LRLPSSVYRKSKNKDSQNTVTHMLQVAGLHLN